MDFYEVPPADGADLRQGDILESVPFVAYSLNEAVVLRARAAKPEVVDLSGRTSLEADSQLLTNVHAGVGIVLNQSCDITGEPGREKPVLIARVVSCEPRIKGFKLNDPTENHVKKIKDLSNPGKAPTVFYLPEFDGSDFTMPKSVADLLEVSWFPPKSLQGLQGKLRLRLTATALQAFQERLAYCFGRFGAPDHLYFSKEEWAVAAGT